MARYFTSPAGGVTGGNRPAPPPSRKYRRLWRARGPLSLTYPPGSKVSQAGKNRVLGSFPFGFLSEIRRDDSRAEVCEPSPEQAGEQARGGDAHPELGSTPSLTYPPGPKVSQAGKNRVLGSFPFGFLSEIRRDDSRAETCEPPPARPTKGGRGRAGGPRAELETRPLTYPPGPEVSQAGEDCLPGSFPFGFLSEIRRSDSRAEIREPPTRTRGPGPRAQS